MKARALAVLLLLAAPLVAGEPPESDPFLAALEGRSGPGAVDPPPFDPWVEAMTWSTRPRREVVDALAACLLRGDASPVPPGKPPPPPAPPPSRIPAGFDPAGVPITDRLAAWVPADAAAAFFVSKADAERDVDEVGAFLARALPGACGDVPGTSRDALRRSARRLLLPPIWGSNPKAPTGTRQVALVASDPDLRWAPDVAFVAEVEDASLVRFHRQASLRWEERGVGVLRVDGLDAWSDEGDVRSFFALEGGVAVWATTKSLRERILAAGAGTAPSLVRPDPRAYALARKTFPAGEGGALLVVPDAFLARTDAPTFRARRAGALRCEAARLLLDAASLAGPNVSSSDTSRFACPGGGALRPVAGDAGSSCSLHGTAASPAAAGDLADLPAAVLPGPDLVRAGGIPATARWSGGGMQVLVPPGDGGALLLGAWAAPGAGEAGEVSRRRGVRLLRISMGRSVNPRVLDRLDGLEDPRLSSPLPAWERGLSPPPRPSGGVLLVNPPLPVVILSDRSGGVETSLHHVLGLKWR